MIIEMKKGVIKKDVDEVIKKIKELGFLEQTNWGEEKIIIAVLGGNTGETDTDIFEVFPSVEKVVRIMKPYKLASRDFQPLNTVVKIDDVEIGGNEFIIMAGPCAVESEEQIVATAKLVKKSGGKILRGGAFKPSTSPFKFQGLREEGLELLALAKKETGLKIVTEVLDTKDVEQVAKVADILQIGSRNAQNFPLLTEAGKSKKPILLKRGFSSTVEEWLQAADYILERNNKQVILCERGIRTFEPSTRFTLDLNSVLVVKRFSHLPIIVDPSHPAGHWMYVAGLAKAGLTVADGLILEIHPDPKIALKDGPQSLTFSDFSRLMRELKVISKAVGKEIQPKTKTPS